MSIIYATQLLKGLKVRVTDPVWNDFLHHARYGQCGAEHLVMLRKLILSPERSNIPDFSVGEWKDVTLITPRHSVREAWNTAALQKHCSETGKTLFICPAEDNIGGRVNGQLSFGVLPRR